MIRHARRQDLERVVGMLGQMAHESPGLEGEFDADWVMAQLADTVIIQEKPPGDAIQGYLRLFEVKGQIAGIFWGGVCREIHNQTTKAYELAVYVDTEFRGQGVLTQMLADFELWAWNAGALRVVLGDSTKLGLADAKYRHLGYEPGAGSWVKVLS